MTHNYPFKNPTFTSQDLYELHATMCRALRLEYDDVEERVVEIPIPDGDGKDIDFVKAVEKKPG